MIKYTWWGYVHACRVRASIGQWLTFPNQGLKPFQGFAGASAVRRPQWIALQGFINPSASALRTTSRRPQDKRAVCTELGLETSTQHLQFQCSQLQCQQFQMPAIWVTAIPVTLIPVAAIPVIAISVTVIQVTTFQVPAIPVSVILVVSSSNSFQHLHSKCLQYQWLQHQLP